MQPSLIIGDNLTVTANVRPVKAEGVSQRSCPTRGGWRFVPENLFNLCMLKVCHHTPMSHWWPYFFHVLNAIISSLRSQCCFVPEELLFASNRFVNKELFEDSRFAYAEMLFESNHFAIKEPLMDSDHFAIKEPLIESNHFAETSVCKFAIRQPHRSITIMTLRGVSWSGETLQVASQAGQ